MNKAEAQVQLEEADKKFGMESLYYLARFVLGYNEMELNPHKEVCAFAEDVVMKRKKGLDLEPRGSFKTSVFSQALPVWLILRDPNVRILLDSQVLQNSVDNLRVVKAHLESPYVNYLYGSHVSGHWTIEEATSLKRTKRNLKEPTIRCASPERVQIGSHYDVIIADDLVSKDNMETPEARQRIKDHFKLLFSLLEPDGVLIVVGTRWHYEDLYGMIEADYGQFARRIKSARDAKTGALYFAKRLNDDFLVGQLHNLGRDFFNSQYLNDPAPEDENALFQKEWFKRFTPDQLPERRYGFIAVDPGGKDKGNDEWAIISAYAAPNSELYFDELRKGNWRLSIVWDYLFAMVAHVKPLAVGFEVTAAQRHLIEALQDEMKRRNVFFNVTELTHAVESKISRIKRLQPRYQAGAIWHSKAMGPLEDQLRRVPKGKDDVADVASMILEVAVSPKRRKEADRGPRSVDDLVWRTVMAKQKGARFVHPTLGCEA